jgi:hypothetical protein
MLAFNVLNFFIGVGIIILLTFVFDKLDTLSKEIKNKK